MHLFDTVVFNGFTVGHIAVGVVVFIGFTIFAKRYQRRRFYDGGLNFHGFCASCDWSGIVSKYNAKCRKCGAEVRPM